MTFTTVFNLVSPFASVWCIVLYIHAVHCLYVWNHIGFPLALPLFFPVIPLEMFASALFNKDLKQFVPSSSKERTLVKTRIIFWFVIFCFWALLIPSAFHKGTSLYIPTPHVFTTFSIMYGMEGYFAYLLTGAFIAAYYFVVYRLRKCRIGICLGLPFLMSLAMIIHFNFFGGIGNYSRGAIERQPGVSIYFDQSSWKTNQDPAIKSLWSQKAREHPRGIYFDPAHNALYVSYGNTYYVGQSYPTILKIDVSNNSLQYVLSKNVRRVSFNGPTIIMAPWDGAKQILYEISKDDLHVKRAFKRGYYENAL